MCRQTSSRTGLTYAGNPQASTTGIINLSDYDVEDVNRMLSFLYNSHYLCPPADLTIHVGMYAMGDMFHLPRLSKYAKREFNEALTRISDQQTFLSLIPRIYGSTPESDRGLRDVAVRNARINYNYYISDPVCKDAFHEVLQTTLLFTMDLMTNFAMYPVIGSCANCGPGQVFRVTKKICTKC